MQKVMSRELVVREVLATFDASGDVARDLATAVFWEDADGLALTGRYFRLRYVPGADGGSPSGSGSHVSESGDAMVSLEERRHIGWMWMCAFAV